MYDQPVFLTNVLCGINLKIKKILKMKDFIDFVSLFVKVGFAK